MIYDIKNNLKEKGWVCPQGIYWNDLVKILEDNNNLNLKIENPLYLGGNGASDKAKYDRFMHHLDIAEKLDILPIIKTYLDGLNDDVFLYSKELKNGNSLNEVGYWDLYNNDLKKIREILLPAVDILKEIQIINPKIIDEDDLYDLFVQNGFSWNESQLAGCIEIWYYSNYRSVYRCNCFTRVFYQQIIVLVPTNGTSTRSLHY